MEALLSDLTEEEAHIARRGRNTKSIVPKSASVHEYRMGTDKGWAGYFERQILGAFFCNYF